MRPIAEALAVSAVVLLCACAAVSRPAVVAASPSAPTEARPVTTPTASPGGAAPLSDGAVPGAGVVYVWGADDGIYRYDGTTGALARVFGAATLSRESIDGPYILGRHGGTTLLRWDGTTSPVCGGGNWSDVSTNGTCAYAGSGTDRAVYVSSPGRDGASMSRMILPADWGAGTFAWDPDGVALAVVRTEVRPEPVRAHQSLWIVDLRHDQVRKVFDPSSETSFISGLRWSGDRRLSLWQNASTSNSFAADGVGISLHVVDVDTGSDRDLGTTLGFRAWAQWSSDGRLAFVSGGGRGTWHAKQVKVLYPDGRIETVAGDGATHPVPGSRSAIAPAWRPVDRDAALSWIEGPSTDTLSGLDYVAGRGPGERIAVVEATVGHVVAACPGSVTEGIRWAADGRSAVLLCRAPSVESHALELWYAPLGGTPRRLVTGLGDLGFGYYGAQPSLLDITAWSLADR